jgi:hypothetical protein
MVRVKSDGGSVISVVNASTIMVQRRNASNEVVDAYQLTPGQAELFARLMIDQVVVARERTEQRKEQDRADGMVQTGF